MSTHRPPRARDDRPRPDRSDPDRSDLDRAARSAPDGPAAGGGLVPRFLIATADERLLDDLLRLAAVAGLTPDVAPDAGSAARYWQRAPLVLVGADLAEPLAALGVGPRAGVVLVSTDLDDATVWRRAASVGAQHVALLPDGEAWLIERLAEAGEARGTPGGTVAVVGGRGGAGASVLATALAVTAVRRGGDALLVDGDPLGGGLDLLVGGEHASGLRWPDLAGTRGRINAAALLAALPRIEGVSLLSWDREDWTALPPGVMREVLEAGRRVCDVTLVDLPRRADVASDEALELATTTLLIVPGETRATAAAARVATALTTVCADVRIVVRGPAPCGLSPHEIAASLGLPLAGSIDPEPRLAEMIERAELPAARGRGPLAHFCAGFLEELLAGAAVR